MNSFLNVLLTILQIMVHEKDGLRVVFAFEVDKSPKTVPLCSCPAAIAFVAAFHVIGR